MNKQISILSAAILAVGLFHVSAAQAVAAAPVIEWDLSGAKGDQASTNYSYVATNISGNSLVRGAGLTGNTGGNSINAKGWNQQATDYFGFGFTVANGFKADLSSLVIGSKSSSTGPGKMGLFYSGDSFANALTTFTEDGSFLNSIVDLSVLKGVTGAIEFRVKQIGTVAANGGTTAGTGTFRIAEYYDGASYTNLQINGSVVAVPEPDQYAMLLGGLGMLALMARRRIK